MREEKELKEEVRKRNIHREDLDRFSLDHRKHKDLKHFQMVDEGY